MESNQINNSEVADFLKENGLIVTLASGEQYFYIPYWFTVNDNGIVDQYDFNDIPQELKDHLESERNNIELHQNHE